VRFLIYGAGAVGGYLGGRLAEAGHDVVFLARPALAAVLRAQGLRLEEGTSARTLTHFEVLTELPRGLDLGPEAAVLLCVKTFDGAAAAVALRAHPRLTAPVVCFLNGIGSEQMLAEALGADRVIPATLTSAVEMRAPGTVRVERARGLGLAGDAASRAVAQALLEGGLKVRRYADGAAMKWSKLPTNIVANASSAILGWSPGAVMRHPGLYRLEVEALRETFRVMRREGLAPVDLPGVPITWLARGIFLPPYASRPWLSRAVARGRGDKLPSFHRDLGLGRSEVRWLNGAVVDHGERDGVTTPANAVLQSTLLALVEGRDDPVSWRDRPERLLQRSREAGVPGIA